MTQHETKLPFEDKPLPFDVNEMRRIIDSLALGPDRTITDDWRALQNCIDNAIRLNALANLRGKMLHDAKQPKDATTLATEIVNAVWDVRGCEELGRESAEGAVADILRRTQQAFDFPSHLQRQREWSERTFGPGARSQGVVDHIRKELREIEADPQDLREWIDVVILALDGAWRSGASPAEIIAALVAKQTRNESREWPDWRTSDPDKAIEHVRSGDESAFTRGGYKRQTAHE